MQYKSRWFSIFIAIHFIFKFNAKVNRPLLTATKIGVGSRTKLEGFAQPNVTAYKNVPRRHDFEIVNPAAKTGFF